MRGVNRSACSPRRAARSICVCVFKGCEKWLTERVWARTQNCCSRRRRCRGRRWRKAIKILAARCALGRCKWSRPQICCGLIKKRRRLNQQLLRLLSFCITFYIGNRHYSPMGNRQRAIMFIGLVSDSINSTARGLKSLSIADVQNGNFLSDFSRFENAWVVQVTHKYTSTWMRLFITFVGFIDDNN